MGRLTVPCVLSVVLAFALSREASAAPPTPQERAERAKTKALDAIADARLYVDQVAAEVKAAPKGEAKTLAQADLKAARSALKQAARQVKSGDRLFSKDDFQGALDAYQAALDLAKQAHALAKSAHNRLR